MAQPAAVKVASCCICAVVRPTAPAPPALVPWPVVCVSQKLLTTLAPVFTSPTRPRRKLGPETAPVA